jgi:hypothetical protein
MVDHPAMAYQAKFAITTVATRIARFTHDRALFVALPLWNLLSKIAATPNLRYFLDKVFIPRLSISRTPTTHLMTYRLGRVEHSTANRP